MKKLLIIPAVLAITSLSGAAFATEHSRGTTWTNSFNTTNTSSITQGINKVSGWHSTAYNTADVTQVGASVTVKGKSCLCNTNLKNSFNTANSSTIAQNIGSVKWGGSAANTATVFQAGASFGPPSP